MFSGTTRDMRELLRSSKSIMTMADKHGDLELKERLRKESDCVSSTQEEGVKLTCICR